MTMREEIADWEVDHAAVHDRIAQRFRHAEARERANRYLTGLLARVEHRNG